MWPKDMKEEVAMLPMQEGLKMMAANGTRIENMGRKIIKFQGEKAGRDFRRQS